MGWDVREWLLLFSLAARPLNEIERERGRTHTHSGAHTGAQQHTTLLKSLHPKTITSYPRGRAPLDLQPRLQHVQRADQGGGEGARRRAGDGGHDVRVVPVAAARGTGR